MLVFLAKYSTNVGTGNLQWTEMNVRKRLIEFFVDRNKGLPKAERRTSFVSGRLKWNCEFSVPRHSKQIKLKIKTVQKITSGIWEMKGGKYAKTLAKIQFRGIFRIRDIRRNVLPKFIEISMETPCWCSSRI